MIYAQQKPADIPKPPAIAQIALPAPALKDSVARVILQDQRDLVVLQVEQLQVIKAFEENQQKQGVLGAKIQAALATALTDSGLDAEKYTVNPNTLSVSEKPKAPASK